MRDDEKKLAELALYIADRSVADPHFGATKLHKLLFYSDFGFYAAKGRAITGAAYQKQEYGPTVKRLLPVQEELIAAGAAHIRIASTAFGQTQKRLIPLRDADLSVFLAEEIAFVDRIIDELRPYNATEISEQTHKLVCWQFADMGDEISYAGFLISSEPVPLSALQQHRFDDICAEYARAHS